MKKFDLIFAFILLPVDIAAIVFSFILAYYFRLGLEVAPAFADIGINEYMRYCFVLLPIWLILLAMNGLYAIKANRGRIGDFYKIFSASSSAMLFLVVWIFLSHTYFFSRLILLFTWVLSILSLFIGRWIIDEIKKAFLRSGLGLKNVLLIGDNETSENVFAYLSTHQALGYKIKGVLAGQGETSKYGLKIVGSIDRLKEKIQSLKIDEVILTDANVSKIKILNIIEICSDLKVVLKYIPDKLSLMNFNFTSELVGTLPVMELKPIPLAGWGRIAKRFFDALFALLLLIITSPVLLIIAFLVKFTSKGPLFYKHTRIGRDQKPFDFYKFRSMYSEKCDWEEKGLWTTAADDVNRITKFGKILRKTNLDELPQLWNILKGDMSFVGPRPELPKLVDKFESEIPDYFLRHRVKTGLTGWAQVNGLKGDTSIEERVRYDIYYIEHWSLWLDIKIIIKTAWMVVSEAVFGKTEYRSGS